MSKFYIGTSDLGRRDVFEWDEKTDPTPEDTGYESIEGPFDTKEEAEDNL